MPELDRREVLGAAVKVGVGAAAVAVGSELVTAGPAGAVPSTKFPWIIDCDGWAARPPSGTPSLSGIPSNKIIVHHMAFPNVTDYSKAEAIKLAQDCQNLHMDTNGWMDTGQHFTISRGGYVLEGRHGSLAALDGGERQIISAHCPGENGRAIGIENEGTYITETPTAALLLSLTRLCIAVCKQYGLKAHDIFGHWDYRETDCPGIKFYSMFPALRRWVALGLGTRRSQIPQRRWPDTWRFVSGPGVKVVQYLLNAQGNTLVVDGIFGAGTLAAIQAWQTSKGIPAEIDGTMTLPTWESLVPELKAGDTGPAVEALQLMLSRKGFGATITGLFDEATVKGVQRLQRLHGLRATGRVGTSTWCAAVGGIVREAF